MEKYSSQRGMERRWWRTIDKPLLFIYIALVVMGWFNIYSAVFDPEAASVFSFSARYGRQLLFIAAAFVMAIVIMVMDVRIITQYAYFVYFAAVFLLLLVLVVGTEISGAKAWIQIGGFSIQPSEFAKFATALAFAKYASSPNVNMNRNFSQIKAVLWFIVPMALILLEPDAGSAIVYLSFLLVLYREGMSGRVLLVGVFIVFLLVISLVIHQYWVIGGLAAISLVVFFYGKKTFGKVMLIVALFVASSALVLGVDYAFNKLKPHQQERINVLLGKEVDVKGAGYNVNQSKIAIGSGGFSGKGYLDGTQTKFNFVPEQTTDFIFCTIGEEWGWIGVTIVLALFFMLLVRIIMLAEKQRNDLYRVYGYCVACILFMHVIVNTGMTIGLLPVIGIPLPFFSYGGSSLWGFTILLFIFIKMDMKKSVG